MRLVAEGVVDCGALLSSRLYFLTLRSGLHVGHGDGSSRDVDERNCKEKRA